MYRSICTKELHFQESQWASVSNEAIDLILWMLSPDSKSRATADEVLSHPWVVRHCGKQLYLEGQELSAMIATASVVLHPQESENKKKGAEEHKGESRMSLKEKEKEKEKENESNQLRRSEEKGHFVHLASVLCPSSAKSSKVLLWAAVGSEPLFSEWRLVLLGWTVSAVLPRWAMPSSASFCSLTQFYIWFVVNRNSDLCSSRLL